jgi:AcrR family transcriptional regulator
MADTASTPARDLILDAAEHLFATRGFSATTIKQIAASASVNSALLYYYFENKETLYREMIRRILSTMAGQGLDLLDHPASPTDGVRDLVRFQSAFLSSHPHLPRLIAREFAGHETTNAIPLFGELLATLFGRLCEIIREGQRQGEFRGGLTPEYAAISTISQVAYLHIGRPAVTRLLGYGPDGPPAHVMADFAEHAAGFALAALRVSPETRPTHPSGET